jgi:hypothetical protein
LQTYELKPHPAFAPAEVHSVTVRWAELPDRRLMLRYRVDGCSRLVLPRYRGNGRGEGLWKTTCFELFLDDGEGRYREYNFSPNGQWAAYAFSSYRNLDADFRPRATPEIKHETGSTVFVQTVFLDRRELEGAQTAALAAVIEENDGRLSYWAMAHPDEKPDFHDPACFRIPLAPAGER